MPKNVKDNNIRAFNLNTDKFDAYLVSVIHEWLSTIAILALTLVPVFFILDYLMMPKELLPRFGIYRLVSTAIVLIQYFVIRRSKPGKLSYCHAYFVSVNVGGIIALMTVDLGGFNSSYYAGLNLVIMGVNLLLPWKAIHSAVNSILIISMYIIFNFAAGEHYTPSILTNNLFFLFSTAIISVSINHVKHKLVRKEFSLLVELKKARDALWSEMELAKRIQTALLPDRERMRGFDVAAAMFPAEEVGGDYYDIIETPAGDKWVTIGDVSGHGVDSGLIMMMAQTGIMSIVNNGLTPLPSTVLESVNSVLRENISRLGSDHYMTMTAVRFGESQMTIAGRHQDIIIHRSASNKTEILPTKGTWLGITDEIGCCLEDFSTNVQDGDVVLLFTDGVTEATSENGEMYGQERLAQALNRHADLPTRKLVDRILDEIKEFQEKQLDDMTLVVVKKLPGSESHKI